MRLFLYIFILGAGLSACSFGKHTYVSGKNLALDSTYVDINVTDSMIAPYKLELDREMNQVISFAGTDLINQRPSGNLGNLMADIILESGRQRLSSSEPAVCLLNFGGLRAPLSQGNITLGDVYKVMPFDNLLVLVKMPASSMRDIRDYLKRSGGEPIAGFLVRGDTLLDPQGNMWPERDYWVVTSDYLYNGGDKMDFFKKKTEVVHTGILLRDELIRYVRATPQLPDITEQRIRF